MPYLACSSASVLIHPDLEYGHIRHLDNLSQLLSEETIHEEDHNREIHQMVNRRGAFSSRLN